MEVDAVWALGADCVAARWARGQASPAPAEFLEPPGSRPPETGGAFATAGGALPGRSGKADPWLPSVRGSLLSLTLGKGWVAESEALALRNPG